MIEEEQTSNLEKLNQDGGYYNQDRVNRESK